MKVNLLNTNVTTLVLLLAITCLQSACSDDSTNGTTDASNATEVPDNGISLTLFPEDNTALSPRIRRTAAGIPHIDGDSLSAVAAGLGYVQAEDNLCVLADGFLKVRGERAEFLGPGADNEHIVSDFSYRVIALREKAEAALGSVSDETRALIDGYVAGYNQFLEISDANEWPAECRDQPWVREIDSADLLAYNMWLNTLRSSEEFAEFGDLLAAVPPGVAVEPTVVSNLDDSKDLFGLSPVKIVGNSTTSRKMHDSSVASNAWGIGSELTENGRGALLANPHFPYTGSLRLYQSHLTVANELNVMGAGLLGVPIPLIAFNENLAWTHTVSSSVQFTVYRLNLDPDNPLAYIKDGASIPITSRTVQIEVANGSDTNTVLERSFYDSEYGPMLSMSSVTNGALPSWAEGKVAFSFRDATDNIDFLTTWVNIAKSSDLSEIQSVFADCGSTLWTNSIFTDIDGNAFYIDSSAVPNLSTETLAAIDNELDDDLFKNLFNNRFVLLDGSTSRDDWIEGNCAGRVPYENVPKLQRGDFVQNSNSSFWATNPSAFLTGFSPLFGAEQQPVNERTRLGLSMLLNPTDQGLGETSPAGDDGKFNAEELLEVIWNNRAFYAEAYLPEVIDRCQLIGNTEVQLDIGISRSVEGACAVLASWSGNYNANAVGAHVFRVLLGAVFERGGVSNTIEFDPADPVNTPGGLSSENRGTELDPVLQALVVGIFRLESASIALDATLGSVQTYTPSGGAVPGDIPIELADSLPWHGGNGDLDGAFNAIRPVLSSVQQNTALPRLSGDAIPNTGLLSAEPGVGWSIARGTGFHMGLQFNDDGPEAWGLLSYGQSTNPDLPWYAEQSFAYSNKTPRQFNFKEDDIASAVLPDGELTLSIEPDQ